MQSTVPDLDKKEKPCTIRIRGKGRMLSRDVDVINAKAVKDAIDRFYEFGEKLRERKKKDEISP